YLNHRRKASRLSAWFRIRVSLRHVRLIVLDCHSRRKRHRFFAEPADIEFVRRGHVEHELAPLLQDGSVIGDELDERRGRSEDVIALAAASVIRRNELGAGIDWYSERRLGRD